MTFWIVTGVVCVVGFALAWWTSGRSKRGLIDPRDSQIQSDALGQQQAQQRFDPGGPFGP
jgi:hypothetical protein